MTRALVSLARFPRPGKVKTRLAASLGPEGAARVYEAFLQDLGRKLGRGHPWAFCWAWEPPEAPFPERMADGLPAFPQAAGDLGARMRAAMQEGFRRGHDAVALIGSDLPHLPGERIEGAFRSLEGGDDRVVLGPAEDGGYYLIGARKVPPVFTEMTWGVSDVLARTRERLRDGGLQEVLLETSYDVDREEDLARLFRDVESGRVPSIPSTEAVLTRLAEERHWRGFRAGPAGRRSLRSR